MLFRPFRRPLLVVWTLLAVIAGAGCEGCFGPPPGVDAGDGGGGDGVDGGGEGRNDAGSGPDDGGPGPDGSVGEQCNEDTPGYGEPCAAVEGDPLCGEFLCSVDNELICWDPDGPNDCGACGELDETQGIVGEACGEFGCGIAACGADGTATICEGDHPRNQCGGCADILPASHAPGQVCSTCGTGTRVCARDLNSLVCWRGRSPDNTCGGCERCVLFHAWMDDRFGGGYVRNGTLGILEDIGGGERILVFDPLIEGPGANALVRTQVRLSTTPDPRDGAYVVLTTNFATSGEGADPYRQYSLANVSNIGQYRYLVLFDLFLDEVISAGQLIAGPPEEIPDAGPIVPVPEDAGMSLLDAGPFDAGVLDAGLDAGLVDDAG